MSDIIRLTSEFRSPETPLLIVALRDRAGQTASAAVDVMLEEWDADFVAEIDPDPFFDFNVERPIATWEHGGRVIEWPSLRFHSARPIGSGRDVLILSGPEPGLRWRSLIDAIAEFLRAAGVQEVVSVSTFPGPAPHTRDVPLRMTATDPEFAEPFLVDVVEPHYQGPIGFAAALTTALRDRGAQTAHLFGVTPFYLGVAPNPLVALELIRAIDRGLGASTPLQNVQREAAQFRERVDELAEAPQLQEVVGRLEAHYDAEHSEGDRSVIAAPALEVPEAPDLPSGGEAVADVEEFLHRSRGGTATG